LVGCARRDFADRTWAKRARPVWYREALAPEQDE